jgi:GTP-binding protein HflX
LAVFDCELKPGQASKLEEILGVRVISRTELILDIFAQHARSSEASLQVESAQLHYLLPRLSGKGVEMSRLGGGIGTRGPGETKLETDRRHIRRRLDVLKRKLAEIEKRRELLRAGRTDPTASLVGYTNAGKSTLLNLLAREELKVQDALFVTLDPVIRKVWLGEGRSLLVSDTVGFISHLPHHLVASFRATLGEVRSSAFLIHLVDASDPDPEGKMQVTKDILSELEALDKPMLLVFNKCDRAEPGSLVRLKASWPEAVFVSARSGEGVAELKTRFLSMMSGIPGR